MYNLHKNVLNIVGAALAAHLFGWKKYIILINSNMSIFIQHDGPFKRTQKCHNRRRGDKDLQVRPSGVRDLGSSMLKRLGPSGSVDRTVLSVCMCV